MAGSSSIRDILLDENMFDGTNFPDWELKLRIVLGFEKLLYTIDKPIGPEPPREDKMEWDVWNTHHDDNFTVQSIILSSINPEFRRHVKGGDPCTMMAKLRDLHESYLRVQRYEVMKELCRKRMAEGMSVEEHVTDMIARIDRLTMLGMVMQTEVSIDLILQSLPDSFANYVLDVYELNEDTTLGEFASMLKEAELELSKGKKQETSVTQKPSKAKGKSRKYPKASGGVKKPKAQPSSGKTKDKSQDVCLHCGERGHWKRDCQAYKAELKEKEAGKAPASGSADAQDADVRGD